MLGVDVQSNALITHLKNTDTDRKANAAAKEIYCGNVHRLWLIKSSLPP